MEDEWQKLKNWLAIYSRKSASEAPIHYKGNEHFAWTSGWESCIEAIKERR